MAARIGINGFGRIGRLATRIAIENPACNLRAINSGADVDYMAYQLKYDSVHGKWKGHVEVDGTDLVLNGQRVKTFQTRDPAEIPWGDFGVDYLCESTGQFVTAESCAPHIAGGVKKVVFSAPAKDKSPTIVMGANTDLYEKHMQFVSCASCTTNGLAPLARAVHDAFTIEEGLMTTIHAMTATQKVVDGSSKKDWRSGRTAASNIIPSSTGAAKALALVLPALKGKINGMAFRVPTPDVSVVDLTVRLGTETTFGDLCQEIKRRSEGDMKGILGYSNEKLVSTDYVGCECSSVFDSGASMMLNPRFVKLIAWYDNEYGYANRVVDLMVHMQKVDSM